MLLHTKKCYSIEYICGIICIYIQRKCSGSIFANFSQYDFGNHLLERLSLSSIIASIHHYRGLLPLSPACGHSGTNRYGICSLLWIFVLFFVNCWKAHQEYKTGAKKNLCRNSIYITFNMNYISWNLWLCHSICALCCTYHILSLIRSYPLKIPCHLGWTLKRSIPISKTYLQSQYASNLWHPRLVHILAWH